MRWDIDKALRSFESPDAVINTSLERVKLDAGAIQRNSLVLTEKHLQHTMVPGWRLKIGTRGGANLEFYGFTIHDCVLRAAKNLKKMVNEAREHYGLPDLRTKKREPTRSKKKKISDEI